MFSYLFADNLYLIDCLLFSFLDLEVFPLFKDNKFFFVINGIYRYYDLLSILGMFLFFTTLTNVRFYFSDKEVFFN